MNKLLVGLALLIVSNFTYGQKNTYKTPKTVEFANRDPSSIQIDSNQKWIVPVIFHVLYHANNENIPDSLVLGVLETLHNDFLSLNSDLGSIPTEFKSLIGMPNVNFTLASKLPDGTPTTGILRQFTNTIQFKVSQRKAFIESPIIASASYLNVYICNVNTNGYTPTEDNPKHDGIVINYKKVSKASRTLTHEVGHWLGLYHIFEGGCNDNDKVKDTPGQKKHSFYCPRYPNYECGHSTMFMNFMDYSSCRCFFTEGQVEKMRNYITKYKNFTQ